MGNSLNASLSDCDVCGAVSATSEVVEDVFRHVVYQGILYALSFQSTHSRCRECDSYTVDSAQSIANLESVQKAKLSVNLPLGLHSSVVFLHD